VSARAGQGQGQGQGQVVRRERARGSPGRPARSATDLGLRGEEGGPLPGAEGAPPPGVAAAAARAARARAVPTA